MRVPSIPYLSREEGERKKERNKGRYWPGESLETSDFFFWPSEMRMASIQYSYKHFMLSFHEVPLDVCNVVEFLPLSSLSLVLSV